MKKALVIFHTSALVFVLGGLTQTVFAGSECPVDDGSFEVTLIVEHEDEDGNVIERVPRLIRMPGEYMLRKTRSGLTTDGIIVGMNFDTGAPVSEEEKQMSPIRTRLITGLINGKDYSEKVSHADHVFRSAQQPEVGWIPSELTRNEPGEYAGKYIHYYWNGTSDPDEAYVLECSTQNVLNPGCTLNSQSHGVRYSFRINSIYKDKIAAFKQMFDDFLRCVFVDESGSR